MRTRLLKHRAVRLGAAAATALSTVGVPVALSGSTAAAASSFGAVTPVALHLDNPRGLAFGSDGHLYVAEAGRGGSDCPSGATGPEGPVCFGATGALTRLDKDKPVRLYRFSSIAGPDGTAAEGISDLNQYGGYWHILMGLSTHETPPGLTAAHTQRSNRELGRLIRLRAGTRTTIANVGGQDWNWTNARIYRAPNDFPDANPFVVERLDGRTWVIDAGANTLVQVSGSTATVRTFFPNAATGDAVPTCLAKGPDGAYYVGELQAFGNKAGQARVWRVRPGSPPKVWHTGFSAITGCGFDPQGNFYAVELQRSGFNPAANPAGAVIQVTPSGKRTTLGAGKLFFPQGFAYRNHAIFVSNWSLLPGKPSGAGQPSGQIVRIQL